MFSITSSLLICPVQLALSACRHRRSRSSMFDVSKAGEADREIMSHNGPRKFVRKAG